MLYSLAAILGGGPRGPAQEPQVQRAEAPRGLQFTNARGQPLDSILERISLSASARFRPEYTQNFADFDSHVDDEFGFTSARFRVGLGADFPMHTSLFIELQNNSFWGEDSRFLGVDTTREDDVQVYQAFGEARRIAGSPVGLRIGRQELVYGTELLLGDADFGGGLSHDAVKVTYDGGPFSVHGWYSKQVEQNAAVFTPTAPSVVTANDEDIDFWGVYGMYRLKEGSGLEGYWLFLDDDLDATQDKRHTLGARGYHALTDILSVNGEFAWQFGETGAAERNIRAFAVETGVGLDLKEVDFRPGAEVGYAFATGDDDPAGGHAETFNTLFQDNHPRLGLSDLFSLSNLHAITVKGTVRPHKKLELGAGYYAFWAHQTGDASAPLGAGPGGNSNFIGHESNLFGTLNYTENISLQLAWAHFFPDGYIDDQFGHLSGADRVYLHAVIGF